MSDLTDNERRLSSELAMANNALYEVRLERDRLLADAQAMTALIERLQAPVTSSRSTDLSDDRIAEWAAGKPWNPMTRNGVCMALEIQRRRAEQAAGREHVERVVREAVSGALDGFGGPAMSDVAWKAARRAADRLSVPVLSEEDVEQLRLNRFELTTWGQGIPVDVLDRLIAAGKP